MDLDKYEHRGSLLARCTDSARSPCARTWFQYKDAFSSQPGGQSSERETDVLFRNFQRMGCCESSYRNDENTLYQGIVKVRSMPMRSVLMGTGPSCLESIVDEMPFPKKLF